MTQKIGVILGILFLAVLSVTLVQGAENSLTLVYPTAGGNYSGAINMNVTAKNVTSGSYLGGNFSCTFNFRSSLTANSTWKAVVTNGNTTAGSVPGNANVSVNATYNTAGLEDANNYEFNVNCWNSTAQFVSVNVSGIRLNNTIPAKPSSLSPASYTSVTTSTDQSFSSTVVDRNTTSCTCNIARGGGSSDIKTCTASYSGSTCSATITFNSPTDNGNWYWYMTASDETDAVSSEANVLSVAIPNSGGGLPTTESGEIITPGKINFSLIIAIAVVVLIIFAFMWKFL